MTHSPPSSLEAAWANRTFADSMARTDSPQCWHLTTAIVPPEERRTTDQEPRFEANGLCPSARRCKRGETPRSRAQRPEASLRKAPQVGANPKSLKSGPESSRPPNRGGRPGDGGHVAIRQPFWRNAGDQRLSPNSQRRCVRCTARLPAVLLGSTVQRVCRVYVRPIFGPQTSARGTCVS